ncbi:MAG: hypothetical protein KJO99_05190 [Nitrosopumilus sp.]|nr:hypothetical protein [Nitrosopumilus sp.]NNL53387.1 hypothetical protein [Nitrosopumilus sp.]
MKFTNIILLFLGILAFSFSFGEVHAELLSNNPYILDGSGFAVSKNSIKNSQIDLALSVGFIANGRGTITIEDGFVTLNDQDFVTEGLIGKVLRDGKFIQISGKAQGSSNEQITITLFGRLIQDSSQGSIYSFTGKIIENGVSYKLIHTTKVSGFGITPQVTIPPKPIEEKTTILEIIPGSFNQGLSANYIEAGQTRSNAAASGQTDFRARYFSQDRLTLEPGTTITIKNNDSVSHSILSGKENYNSRYDKFTADGRIDTGLISPGQSVDITFEQMGFYRLYDPNYQWMQIVVYSFPDVDNLNLGSTKNQQGN